MVKRGEMMDVEDIVELLSIDLIGVIPDDDSISTNRSMTFLDNRGSSAFDVFAKNIHFVKNDIFDYKSKYSGIFGAFKRKMRQKYQ